LNPERVPWAGLEEVEYTIEPGPSTSVADSAIDFAVSSFVETENDEADGTVLTNVDTVTTPVAVVVEPPHAELTVKLVTPATVPVVAVSVKVVVANIGEFPVKWIAGLKEPVIPAGNPVTLSIGSKFPLFVLFTVTT
jgi:hypothetical protein